MKLDKPTITQTTLTIDELENEAFTLTVFPNPTSDKATISYAANAMKPFEVLLINTEGKVVLTRKGVSLNGENQLELNTSQLPAGNYHILLKVGESYSNKALIIR